MCLIEHKLLELTVRVCVVLMLWLTVFFNRHSRSSSYHNREAVL